MPDPPDAAARRPGRWKRRLLLPAATLYPLGLLGLALAFRLIGERWWLIAVALYLPRLPLLLPLPFLFGALFLTHQRRAAWLLLATSLPIFLGLMGFVAPWPVARDATPTLRVLSCNVNSSEVGDEAILAAIAKQAPDFVILQEVGLPDTLSPKLRAAFPTVRRWDQFVVGSRFPMTPAPDAPDGRAGLSPRQGYIMTWWWELPFATPLGPLSLFNVHPMTPREALESVREGLHDEWRRGRRLRRERIDIINENTRERDQQVADLAHAAKAETSAVLLVGDTNLPALSRILAEQLGSFHDGFTDAGWGFGYTFPTTHSKWMRIDRMLSNDRLRFVSFAVVDSGISDHACIVAEVQAAR
jgi:endonuclease/exonuclease/phosphatase (EEP) superfamily protein YafD